MEDVPLPSSTQTTDQIIVFPDIEGKEGGGSEESAIETVPVTRKRGRPRKPLPPRFVVEEDEEDDNEMEDVPLPSSTQTTDQIL